MIKKLGFGFAGALAFLSQATWAAQVETQLLVPEVTYKLVPNKPLNLLNPLPWEVKATCAIQSNSPMNLILTTLKSKTDSASVNGKSLTQHVTESVIVAAGGSLQISALHGARVQLLNPGESEITAKCSI